MDYIYQGPVILVLLVGTTAPAQHLMSNRKLLSVHFGGAFRGAEFKPNYFLCVFFLLDKLCFPLQHSKNSNDQTQSFNHI